MDCSSSVYWWEADYSGTSHTAPVLVGEELVFAGEFFKSGLVDPLVEVVGHKEDVDEDEADTADAYRP